MIKVKRIAPPTIPSDPIDDKHSANRKGKKSFPSLPTGTVKKLRRTLCHFCFLILPSTTANLHIIHKNSTLTNRSIVFTSVKETATEIKINALKFFPEIFFNNRMILIH